MLKMPSEKIKAPKKYRIVFAVLALLIIIIFTILAGAVIYYKSFNLFGLSQVPITNCTDTDGGNLQETFGTCTDSVRQTHSDTCVFTGLQAELKLQEWSCKNDSCSSEIKACQLGFVCSVGRCIKA